MSGTQWPPHQEGDLPKSELAKAIEAKVRKSYPFVVNDVFGLGKKPIHKIRIRELTKGEEEQAIRSAIARIDALVGDMEHAREDPDLINDAKAMEIIALACRTEDDKMQAFPGGKWLKKLNGGSVIGYLFNLVNQVKQKEGVIEYDLSLDKIEAIINLCVRAQSSDIPERVLAAYQREALNSLVIVLCLMIHSYRQPGVTLERDEETGWWVTKHTDGSGPDYEALPDGWLNDPELDPDVAGAVADIDEQS